MIYLAREYNLKPAPSLDDGDSMFGTSKVINRRQFLKYGFNTATGVLAASKIVDLSKIPVTRFEGTSALRS